MSKSKSRETVPEATAQAAPAKSLHEQILDAQTALHELSARISQTEASVEAAIREVQRARAEERKRLADYQRHLLAGEKLAADAALAEVSTAREQTARAVAAVPSPAGSGSELQAQHERIRVEILRLSPLAQEAFNEIRQDMSLVRILLDVTQGCSSTIHDKIDLVLTEFAEGAAK